MARSHSLLANSHLSLGDLARAEEHAHLARKVHEGLGLKDAYRDYHTLAAIAHARDSPTEAAAWERKREASLAELDRRAGGPALSPLQQQGIAQLALACAQPAVDRAPFDADHHAALSALSNPSLWPAPFDTLAPFLHALAAGTLPTIPPSLPAELTSVLTQVLDTLGPGFNHPVSASTPPPLPSDSPCLCGSGERFLDCHAADTDATD